MSDTKSNYGSVLGTSWNNCWLSTEAKFSSPKMLNALPNGGPIFIPFEQKMSFLFYLFCQRIWNLCICSGLRGKRREVLCVIQRLPSFAFNNLQIHRNAVAVSFFVKMRLFVREKKRLRSKKIREKKNAIFSSIETEVLVFIKDKLSFANPRPCRI